MATLPYLDVPLFSYPAAPGGLLYTYAAGGTTPKTTYSSADTSTPNTNPVVLDTNGNAVVRGTGAYHFLLKDSTGSTTLWDADNYQVDQYLIYFTQAYLGAIIWPQTAAELAASVTPSNYGYQPGNVLRYGAVADGSGTSGTDNTTAFQSALNSNQYVWVPDGSYLIDSITVPSNTWLDLRKSTLLFKGHSSSGNIMISMGTSGAAVSHAKITGGFLNGNIASQTFPSEQFSHGIRIWGSDYNTIDGVVVHDVAGDCINIGYNSGRVVGSNGNIVSNCELYNPATVVQRQCVALVYGDENSILYNRCSGTIDVELNAGVGELKNNLIHGNKGRDQTESLTTPRISDLRISLASANTTPTNYYGNVVSNNHCYTIQLQYNNGTVINNNVVVGSTTSQTQLIDIAGGQQCIVDGNMLYGNTAVATSLTSIIRTRAGVDLTVTNNISNGDSSSVPFHNYSLTFGAEPNAAGHTFKNNQTASGYYRNTSYPMPSEWARFRIDQTNGGSLALTQTAGVRCNASISRSGTNAILTGVGNAGTGYLFKVLAECDKANAASSNRPDACAVTWSASGSNRTITAFTYTPAAGAVTLASFSFASAGGTGTFDVEVWF